MWKLNPDIFLSTDVTRLTKLFTVNIQDGRSKEKFADSKISGYVWTGKFDLNPDTCGRGNFCVRKEKVAENFESSMYPDSCES